MPDCDIVHVAIAPPNTIEDNLVRQVATVINKDSYTTRLLLAGNIPKILAHYQTIELAESVIRNLKALGLVAFICKDSELRTSSSVKFRAYTMKLEDGEVTFLNKGSQATIMKAENVSLIIKGIMRTYAEKEAIKTKVTLNLPATILSGGIPMLRKVKEKIINEQIETECFVRLYNLTSLEPAVEIFQYHFDYSFLGEKVASSFININTIAMMLRETFPQAIFDDRLTKPLSRDNNIDISCKLIYLCHQAVSRLGTSA